eukprot:13735303-Heterocapsa_arctica.AAC.1
MSMEIDTEDVEVLKNRLATNIASFENLEDIMNALRAENTAHTTSIAAFETARIASEAQSS